MKCPVCETVALSERKYDQQLPSQFCDACHGHWLAGENMEAWRKVAEAEFDGKPHVAPYLVETPRVLFCPNDGHILVKYRFGIAEDFYFDRCAHCEGVWFDRHEWEVMRSRGLTREIRRIFSDRWLEETIVQEQATDASYRRENLLQSLLNHEQYTEISQLRNWLDSHPNRRDVLSVLLSGSTEHPISDCAVNLS